MRFAQIYHLLTFIEFERNSASGLKFSRELIFDDGEVMRYIRQNFYSLFN
jgi:hypothetical protein